MAKQKVSLTEQLYDLVDRPTEELEEELQELKIDARQYNQIKEKYMQSNLKKGRKYQ